MRILLNSFIILCMNSSILSQDKEGYTLVFNDDFNRKSLNAKNWFSFYLPQWSSRNNSKPKYSLEDGCLLLQITESQKPWCTEFNGEVKCSSLQTGVFSGDIGSNLGQHHFTQNLRVREFQAHQKKFVPQYGYFEIKAKALNTISNVVSLWMIGFEDTPEHSAEICIFEVKGENVQKNKAKIGYGIHQFKDPNVKEAFFEDEFSIDVTQFHIYAAEWTPTYVDFYIDNKFIRRINQSPNYPMQFMLGIYEIPVKRKSLKDKKYPKEFVIDYVKGYKKAIIK